MKLELVYDFWEVFVYVEVLVRAVRSFVYDKVDYYVDILDELKGRFNVFFFFVYKRLLMGFLGDSVRVKVVKKFFVFFKII